MESLTATSKKMMVAVATNELIMDTPFGSVQIDAVCRVAGMSRYALCQLFDDKYEIPLSSRPTAMPSALSRP